MMCLLALFCDWARQASGPFSASAASTNLLISIDYSSQYRPLADPSGLSAEILARFAAITVSCLVARRLATLPCLRAL